MNMRTTAKDLDNVILDNYATEVKQWLHRSAS